MGKSLKGVDREKVAHEAESSDWTQRKETGAWTAKRLQVKRQLQGKRVLATRGQQGTH